MKVKSIVDKIIKYYKLQFQQHNKSQMAQQQETLENCIQMIQNPKDMSERSKVRILTKIIKHFSDYTKDTEILPPQTLIPCCLFVVPIRFCELLNIQEDQPLDVEPEKKAVDLVLQTYLKALSRLLQKCDNEIKHVVIEGISKSILLTVAYPKISKKWLKSLIDIWAGQSLNINLGLRAFIAINKFLRQIDDEIFMWTLRRIYVAFFENSKQVSWRNLEHVNFMTNCFCELVKINESRSYYVLFGYVRSIALQMANLNKSKRKEKVDLINKLYSNQVLNCFKLFTAIVSRVNSQELTSLIYPLIELTVAYERISKANEFVPLKLHLISNLLTIMESTGIYIPPIIDMIQSLLENKIFAKKLSKKGEKVGGDLELSYRLSLLDFKNTALINQIFENILYKIYWFITIAEKLAGGAEIIKKMTNILKGLDLSFKGYKIQVSQFSKLLRQDFYQHYKLRASKRVSILDKKGTEIIQKDLEKYEFIIGQKYESIKEEKAQMLRQKLLAENEEDGQGQEGQQQKVLEDDDELNSGWQEAESGASSFHESEGEDGVKHQDSDSEQMEDEKLENVSYEGDLDEEAADQAIREWSQAEWSSQEQVGA